MAAHNRGQKKTGSEGHLAVLWKKKGGGAGETLITREKQPMRLRGANWGKDGKRCAAF